MKSFAFFLIFLFACHVQSDATYNLILHSKQRGASCLDGSPAGMYLNEGTGVNKTKFLLFFNGGGFCGGLTLAQTLESCYKRSQTNLGTTTVYSNQTSFQFNGILSTRADVNPHFHDWTKVVIIYCDGASHQGYRESSISYKGKNLYFRGTRNTLQHFHYLETKYDFYNGDAIFVTGTSAGGLGTFQWSNQIQSRAKKAKVYSMPDSGLFLTNYFSPIVGERVIGLRIKNLLSLVMSQSQLELPDPIRKCLNTTEFKDDYLSCFDAGNFGKFLTAPTLIIQSPYDQYCLDNILIVKCLKNIRAPYSLDNCNSTTITAIDDYRKQMIKSAKGIRSSTNSSGVIGAWGPACVQHCFISSSAIHSNLYRIPSGTGQTIQNLISIFLRNPSQLPWLLEEISWPGNKGCDGEDVGNLRENVFEE